MVVGASPSGADAPWLASFRPKATGLSFHSDFSRIQAFDGPGQISYELGRAVYRERQRLATSICRSCTSRPRDRNDSFRRPVESLIAGVQGRVLGVLSPTDTDLTIRIVVGGQVGGARRRRTTKSAARCASSTRTGQPGGHLDPDHQPEDLGGVRKYQKGPDRDGSGHRVAVPRSERCRKGPENFRPGVSGPFCLGPPRDRQRYPRSASFRNRAAVQLLRCRHVADRAGIGWRRRQAHRRCQRRARRHGRRPALRLGTRRRTLRRRTWPL
jgi:hypothetical protein